MVVEVGEQGVVRPLFPHLYSAHASFPRIFGASSFGLCFNKEPFLRCIPKTCLRRPSARFTSRTLTVVLIVSQRQIFGILNPLNSPSIVPTCLSDPILARACCRSLCANGVVDLVNSRIHPSRRSCLSLYNYRNKERGSCRTSGVSLHGDLLHGWGLFLPSVRVHFPHDSSSDRQCEYIAQAVQLNLVGPHMNYKR